MILLKIDSDSYHLIESKEVIDEIVIFYTIDSKCIPESNCRIMNEHEFKMDYLLKLKTDKVISKREQDIANFFFFEKKEIKSIKNLTREEFLDWRDNQIIQKSYKTIIKEKIKNFFNYFKSNKKKRNDEFKMLSTEMLFNEFFSKFSEESLNQIMNNSFLD